MAYTNAGLIYAQEPEINIIQLTDDSNAGSVNLSFLNECISVSDALIDSYLNGHVSGWPISPTPAIIEDISTVLTIFNIYMRRFGVGNVRSSVGLPETLEWRYNDAIKKLEKIVNGTINISVDSFKYQVFTRSKTQIFTDEFLAGY